MQHHPQSIVTPPVLEGHVFARQQLFMTLPKNLQEDAKQFRAFVEQDKSRLFQNNRHAFVKSVYSVKGKDLIDAIIHWLKVHYAPVTKSAPVAGLEPAWEGSVPAHSHATAAHTVDDVTKEQLEAAKQVAEALVLMGFVTPYKEDDTHLTSIAPDHYVHDSELLIPIAPSVTDLTTTSVWSVADGAVYARNLKRKAGVLGQITDGKDVYVVFNDKSKMAYLFASDLAREPISELSGPTLDVQFDNSHFQFGVRVSLSTGVDIDTSEHFNAETKVIQQELVNAFLGIGTKFVDAASSVNAPVSHSDDQFVGKFAEIPTVKHDDTAIGGHPAATKFHGQEVGSVPTGAEQRHDVRFDEHSAAPTHHNQARAPQGDTSAYAPVVAKQSAHLAEAHAAPHAAP
ncbi:Phospholipid hydroperoxide glutathione [Globisporangium polare]